MFKRFTMLALLLLLPAFVLGGGEFGHAKDDPGTTTDDWLTDGTIQSVGWEGIPDRRDLTARFLVVDGFGNNGLGAEGGAGQVNSFKLTFARDATRARVALFDPNSIGNWDQRVDRLLVDRAPDVRYEVYGFQTQTGTDGEGNPIYTPTEDLLSDNDVGNNPAPFHVMSAYHDFNDPIDPLDDTSGPKAGTDDVWCAFVDEAPADLETMAQAVSQNVILPRDGRTEIYVRVVLLPPPQRGMESGDPMTVPRSIADFTGRERAGYKVAFNGTYLFPANTVIGFAGGRIDERVRCAGTPAVGCSETQDPRSVLVFNEDDYQYDGQFNFHIHSTHACPGDIDFFDADADWNAAVELGPDEFLSGALLTGIPPENVPRYIRPNDFLCDGKRDIGASTPNCSGGDSLLIGGQISWAIFPTLDFPSHLTGGTPTPANPDFSSAADAADGHPSITAALEPGADKPFKKQTLDQATLLGKPGLWCLRWEGVDKANFVFMKFSREVGTTPKPSIGIRVFCDADGDCIYDQGETPVPTNGGVVKLRVVEVECDPDPVTGQHNPVPGGVDTVIETDANGVWGPNQFRPACFLVDLDPSETLLPSASCTLPILVDASLRPESGSKDCTDVEIGMQCEGMICGRVYCENGNDCTYDPAVDGPLPAGAAYDVTLTPIVQGVPDAANSQTVTVDDTDPNYCFQDLPFGDYRITIAPANAATLILTLAGPCTDTKDATISSASPNIADCDFGYECQSRICGDVYCEETGNCLYEPAMGEMPLPAGTQVTLTLTPVLAGIPDVANAVTQVVTAPDTRFCFEDLEFGEYTLTYAFTDGRPPMPIAPNCEEIKEITLDPATGEIDDCDFGFDCTGDICGDAYCEIGGTPCVFDQGTDEPLPVGSELEVILSRIDLVGGVPTPVEIARKTVTAPATRYCFEDLPYGDYQLAYAWSPASPVLPISGGCPEVKLATVSRDVQLVDDCDFGFECTTSICGDVYCKSKDGDCKFDVAGGDMPLPAGTIVDIILTPVVGGVPQPGLAQTASVVAPLTRFCFQDLAFGEYLMTFVYNVGSQNQFPIAKDCDPVKEITLDPATGSIDDCDFGFECDAEIDGRVYCDDDMNGSFDPVLDTPLVGWTVEVRPQGGGAVVATAITGADGTYEITGLAPGSYTVTTQAPAGTPAGTYGPLSATSVDVTVPPRASDVDFYFDCRLGEIRGRLFCDDNQNGVWDVGEPLLDGFTVDLQDAGGAPISSTTTAGGGLYAFTGLVPATYRVAVVPSEFAARDWAAPNPTFQSVVVGRGDIVMDVDFGADCRLGEIRGYIYCDDNLNGVFDLGVDRPLEGFSVRGIGPNGAIGPVLTGVDGGYVFADLAPGAYRIFIDPSEFLARGNPVPVPAEVGVALNRGDLRTGVDFGTTCLGSIFGYVFEDKFNQDCDGIYQEGADRPLVGAMVRLIPGPGVTLPPGTPTETLTGVDGRYEFLDLPPGSYRVELVGLSVPDQSLNLSLNEAVTPRLRDVVVEENKPKRIDFGHCAQAVCGKVFKQPFGKWDQAFDEGVDTPLPGILVEITGTAGEALAVGFSDSVRTDAEGEYCFTNIPTGSFEIVLSTSDGQTIAILEKLIDDGVTVRTPDVTVGETVLHQDFAKCEPCAQSLCVRVFREPAPDCDGLYDVGLDELVGNVEIRIQKVGGGQTILFTEGDGRICLDDVEPGDYIVTIDEGQPELKDCTASAGTQLQRMVFFDPERCEDQELDFAFCCCPREGCCEGRLHEAVAETRFFLGAQAGALDVRARLFMDCQGNDLVDEVEANFVGSFPGPVQGMGEVLSLERVENDAGIVTVRLRMTARGTSFPENHFGGEAHLLQIAVNGELHEVCEVFRAERMHPGVILGCQICEEIETPCDCGPCDGKVTSLTLRYDGAAPSRVTVQQKKDGTIFDGTVAPGEEFSFSGTDKDGTMGTEITVTSSAGAVAIHTSCSKPIGPGLVFGPFTVISGESRDGGVLCAPGADGGSKSKKKSNKSKKKSNKDGWDWFDGSATPTHPVPSPCGETRCRPVEFPCVPGARNVDIEWDIAECDTSGKIAITDIWCFKDWCRCFCDCPPPVPCGECKGGVVALTLRYDGTRTAQISVGKPGEEVFFGTVAPGESFSYQGESAGDKIPEDVYIDGRLDVAIHASCSQDVSPGTKWGSFTVLGGASKKGGEFCGSELSQVEPACRACCEPEVPCSECKGGVVALTLRYDGTRTAEISVGKPGKEVFRGIVAPGGSFSYEGETPGDKVPEDVFIDGRLDVAIHTSCSQDVSPGTKWGSFTILGGASKKGGPFCDKEPPCEDCPQECSECDGKVTTLTLRYEGATASRIVVQQKKDGVIFDGTVAPGEEFSFNGTDKDGTMGTEITVAWDGGSVAIHTSCSKPIGVGLRFGPFQVMAGESLKGGPFCGTPTPPCEDCGGGDCSECDGKVTRLTLRYDGAAPSRVTVQQKKDGIIFDGTVAPGEEFTFSGTDKGGTMGTEITVTSNAGAVAIHTSCSQPIGPGLVFGAFTVISGESLNGGTLCAPGTGGKTKSRK